MKYLYIEDLKNALAVWEYANLYAEVLHQKASNGLAASILSPIMSENQMTPLAGSELGEHGFLARGINKYKSLRKFIEEDQPYSVKSFLPRIPKSMRELVSHQYSLARSNYLMSIYRLPLMLDGWLDTRKVFVLEDIDLVSVVRPNHESYLNYMPYESFIIKVDNPFYIFIESEGEGEEDVQFPVSTILVSSDDEYIDFMVIPSSIEGLLPKASEIKKLEKLVKNPKKSAPGVLMRLYASQETPCGFEFMGYSVNRNTLQIHEYQENRLYKYDLMEGKNPIVVETSNSKMMHTKEVLSIINGLCKLISEIPTQERKIELQDTSVQTNDNLDHFEWYKIAVTEAKYLDNEGKFIQKEEVKHLLGGFGSEKSYHKRRGHWRTIKSTGKRYWVEETEVRADKKNKEPMKGSAMQILRKK